jgi:hypothetical protein
MKDQKPTTVQHDDRCPTCHGLGEGCTATVCHGLDSD